jgi:putative oxidoreductase
MSALAPLGRLLFSAIFILSGLRHFTNFEGLVGYTRASGVPLPEAAVLVSGVVLLAGGLAVLLGLFARLGAVLLAGFLVLAALTVHDFWTFEDPQQAQQQQSQFMKNMALAGGALLLVYFGPGPYSLRQRRLRGAEAPGARVVPPLRPRPQE